MALSITAAPNFLLCAEPASLQAWRKTGEALGGKKKLKTRLFFQDATSHLLLIYISSFCLNCVVLWTSLERSSGWLPSNLKAQQSSAAMTERAAPAEQDAPIAQHPLDTHTVPQEKSTHGNKTLSFSFFTPTIPNSLGKKSSTTIFHPLFNYLWDVTVSFLVCAVIGTNIIWTLMVRKSYQ